MSKIIVGSVLGGAVSIVIWAVIASVTTGPALFMLIGLGAGAGVGAARANAELPGSKAGTVALGVTAVSMIVGRFAQLMIDRTADPLAAVFSLGWLGWVFFAIGLIASFMLASASGPAPGKHRLREYRNDGNRVALVFVHGFLGDAHDTWESLANAIKQDPRVNDWDIFSFGYSTNLNLEMAWAWTADPDLPTVTRKLITEAKHSSKLKRYDRIAVAAHSMGGLVTQRAILDDEDFRHTVDLVMLFGTPSAGRSAAPFAFLKRQVKQMDPNGSFITSLRSDWNELWKNGSPGFRLYAVAGSEDNFIPASTSLEPFPEEQRRVIGGDHLSMVEASGPDDEVVQLIVGAMVGDASDAGPWNSAQVAIERGDFQEAIRTFEPHVAELDAYALGRLALAYAATDRADKAIQILEEHGEKGGTDAMGILGGQLKRRWMYSRKDDDAKRSRELYQRGFDTALANSDHDQAYYHAINLAFLALAYSRDAETAAAHARTALEHCAQAAPGMWRAATEAEAQLYLGDRTAALDAYRSIIDQPDDSLTPRMVRSMYVQAQSIAEISSDRSLTSGLDKVFQKGT